MRRLLFFKISGAAYLVTVLAILLLPSGVRAGTFYEGFSTDQKKDASTSADWNTNQQQMSLPTVTNKPLVSENYQTNLGGDYERGYIFRVLYDGKNNSARPVPTVSLQWKYRCKALV